MPDKQKKGKRRVREDSQVGNPLEPFIAALKM